MPPELREVKRWLEKARHDWLTAQAAVSRKPAITDTAAFHCQQAVEKMLKAYLVHRRQAFEKIHDLEELTDRCAKHEPAFVELRDLVRPLSAYAVRFRYPGPADPSTQEVQEALDVVREVWQFVTGRLPSEVAGEAEEA